MSEKALKTAFAEELSSLVSIHPEIIVLCSDSRGSSGFSSFAKNHPDNFIETGIAEQDEVGIASGLASVGFRPYVAAPAAFLSSRAVEQIKVDVAYSHMNVKLFGVSGGISYGPLGASHYSINDIAVMRGFADFDIFIPSDANQMKAIAHYSVKTERGCYIRAGREAVPEIYENPESAFQYGKANILKKGQDVTIIAIGEMVYSAIKAATILEGKGISATVIDSPCIKPFDTKTIINAALSTGCMVTIEEHSIYGGLGSAVAETLVSLSTPLKCIALPDTYFPTGNSAEIKKYYRMTPEDIAEDISVFVKERK